MIRRVASLLLSSIFLLSLFVSVIHARTIPPFKKLVSDSANSISPQLEAELNTELSQFAEQSNGFEVAIVTLDTLDNESIGDVAKNYYDEWKIGKGETDNGVLILVARKENQVIIYRGAGAKDLITDEEAAKIISEQLEPALKASTADQGVREAITTIRQELTDQTFGNINPLNKEPGFMKTFIVTIVVNVLVIICIMVISFAAAKYGKLRALWLGGLVGAVLGTLAGGPAAGIFFGTLGLGMDYWVSTKHTRHA